MSGYQYSPPHASPRPQFRTDIFEHFLEDGSLPLCGVLTQQDIQQQLDRHNVNFAGSPGDIWTPLLTLWVFVIQCLNKDKSCAAAVIRAIGLLHAHRHELCSSNTGAYCKARAKLPPDFLRDLALHVGWELENRVPSAWRLFDHRVFVVDGSTVTLPDTKKNRQKYPQQRGQKPGVGLPILRILVVFSLTTGAVLAVAWAPCRGKQTGETALLRSVWEVFQPGDVLLADSYFAGYFTFALARRKGVHLLFCAHHLRKINFRAGQRLGPRDHRVAWEFPARPDWMDEELYESLRQELQERPLEIRELELKVAKPGFRTKTLRLATTLTDVKSYPKTTLAVWYRQRWNAELDLRNLKTTLGMEHLRCQSPEMVHRELWAHFLAYNLVRKCMCQAALATDKTPRALSFNFARQILQESIPQLVCYGCLAPERHGSYCQILLQEIARHQVGTRPDRVEPRAVKRRPKPHKLLQKPRQEAIAELLAV
jgi:hypothetical protein